MQRGWYNARDRRDFGDAYPRGSNGGRNRFLAPSLILLFLGLFSMGISIANITFSKLIYFTDDNGADLGTWKNCSQQPPSLVAPITDGNVILFWIYASIGLIIGLWCFLLGLWAIFTPTLKPGLLKALLVILMITFLGCLIQVVLGILDVAASFVCFDTTNMDTASNVKATLPTVIIVLGVLQLFLAAIIFAMARGEAKRRGLMGDMGGYDYDDQSDFDDQPSFPPAGPRPFAPRPFAPRPFAPRPMGPPPFSNPYQAPRGYPGVYAINTPRAFNQPMYAGNKMW